MADLDPESHWAAEGYEPDIETVRARYRAEREKRLRPEGQAQYQFVTLESELAKYTEDPYVERVERDPVHDTVEVTVIGGGFAGMLLGARLRQAGGEGIRVGAPAGGFGGRWGLEP